MRGAEGLEAVCEGGLLGAEFLEGEEGGCGEGALMGAGISLSKKRNWKTDGKSSSPSSSSTSPPDAVESIGRKGSVDAECELGSRCSNISLSLEALTQGRRDYETVEADD